MKIFIIGSINMDLVIKANKIPSNGETISGSDFMSNPGGKGANQAVAVAKLGGKAYMVGKVGNSFGDELINTLKGYGVNTDFVIKEKDVASGIAMITIVDNDNRIILDAGANKLVDEKLIDEALKNADKGDILITQLEIPTSSVAYALNKAHEKEMIAILNPAPASALDNLVFKDVDYFIPNQHETKFYTNIFPSDNDSFLMASLKLKELGVKNVIITMGTAGSMAYIDKQIIKVNAHKVKAIDTTAAGDTYVGALATCIANKKKIKEAMEFASLASSLTVTKKGAQQAIPYLNELNEK